MGVTAPIRIIRNPLGFLYIELANIPFRMGDLYTFPYRPISLKNRMSKQRLSEWLPYWDREPLMIFLEYRPKWRVMYGLNLHYYPSDLREIIIDIIKLVKSRLKILVEADENELEQEDNDNFDELFPPGENIDEQLIADTYKIDVLNEVDVKLKGKRGINWFVLSNSPNKFLRLLPLAFRNYKINLVRNPQNLRDLDEEDYDDELSKTGYIRVTKGGIWNAANRRRTAQLAMQNKDWLNYVSTITAY